jgi:hypothetical protein
MEVRRYLENWERKLRKTTRCRAYWGGLNLGMLDAPPGEIDILRMKINE